MPPPDRGSTRVLLPPDLSIDLREVEVHAENDRQRAECGQGEPRPIGHHTEHRKEERVEGGVRLAVQVPPEQRHVAGQPGETAVRVVEERLGLEQDACRHERCERERYSPRLRR